MAELPVRHEWQPIEDLPADWQKISRPDLDDSLALWKRERDSLKDPSRVEQLEERLSTLWAIETGVIEKLYTIDRGTTEMLIERGLSAIEQFSTTGRLTKNAIRLIEDQRAALDFVFSYIKERRPLSTSYIRELHQLLLRNQEYAEAIDQFGQRVRVPLIRGDWKKMSNNPVTPDGSIHEYCPPDFVQDEMDELIRMYHEHERTGVRPEVEAAWLHHRFTQIHPFQDGNGRVARALATVIFLKAGFLPLVIRDIEHRERYISDLERADAGDLGSLVSLFANIQTKDLEDAITFVREIRGEGITEIAAAAADAARRRAQQDEQAIAAITDRLFDITKQRLEEIAYELKEAFVKAGTVLEAPVSLSNEENHEWWTHQIVHAARTYRYFAETGLYRRWVRLRLQVIGIGGPVWHIVVSFHHKESRTGLMAAVVFLTTSEMEIQETRPVILGSDHEFTFSPRSKALDEDYRQWLEAALRRVLETWQSRI